MCYHNNTQHNGCGHIAPCHNEPWTLCDAAIRRLNNMRGPSSPPLSPAVNTAAPLKRSSSIRTYFSLSRSNTSASRRSTKPATPRDSMSANGASYTPALGTAVNYATLPDYQLNAVRCAVPTETTRISGGVVDVCGKCKRSINDMRYMIERYDKTGNIIGTDAFRNFLMGGMFAAGERDDDVTLPLENGGTQAIIMGYPESAMGEEGGLAAIEREMNRKLGFKV